MANISRKDKKKTNVSRGLHKYIHMNNKTLPVAVTHVIIPIRTRVSRRFRIARKPWPVFQLSDWMKACFNTPEFQGVFMLGGKKVGELEEIEGMLSTFWDRYHCIDPNTPEVPERTIPFYIHGDEGRGLVKRPLLIIAFQCIIGWAGTDHPNSIKKQAFCTEYVLLMFVSMGLSGSSYNLMKVHFPQSKEHNDYTNVVQYIAIGVLCKKFSISAFFDVSPGYRLQ